MVEPEREVELEIGGLRTRIVPRGAGIAGLATRRYAGFLADGPADWRLEVGIWPEGLRPIPDVVVREDGAPGRLHLDRHDFGATVDLEARAGRAALAVVDEIALDSLLRVVYSLALLDLPALLLHAAGLVRDGRAHVFAGPSGRGKTTIARLSPEAALLGDELTVVRVAGGEGFAHGTPFWGDLGRAGENQEAPLAGIYFLRQGDHHARATMSPKDALRALLENVLFFGRTPGLTARVFAVAAAIADTVPCYTLTFRRDAGFWKVVDGA